MDSLNKFIRTMYIVRVVRTFIFIAPCLLFSSGFTVEKELFSTFTLVVEGVENPVGEIRIAVFDSENRYLDEPRYAEIVPVSDTMIEWQIEDLAYGQYAIAVYHDKNKNGKLDTNLLGIPTENYGFSNNARGKFGPASWDQAKFLVKDRSAVHRIKIE
jgi:uncharacterized protein (DUF2141 family)